jgi:hypothetical protein
VGDLGRAVRDVMLGPMKTCAKLGVSFVRYLGVLMEPIFRRAINGMKPAGTGRNHLCAVQFFPEAIGHGPHRRWLQGAPHHQ